MSQSDKEKRLRAAGTTALADIFGIIEERSRTHPGFISLSSSAHDHQGYPIKKLSYVQIYCSSDKLYVTDCSLCSQSTLNNIEHLYK